MNTSDKMELLLENLYSKTGDITDINTLLINRNILRKLIKKTEAETNEINIAMRNERKCRYS